MNKEDIENIIKNYLYENLKIENEILVEPYSSYIQIDTKILLDNEEICSSSDDISAETIVNLAKRNSLDD